MNERPAAPHLDDLPGHYIRRLQQMAVAIFLEETEAHGITPVQYAALQAVHDRPQLDQRTLSRSIGFDTSTIGGVIDRLEKRGLMQRNASDEDRRVRLLTLTAEGEALLEEVQPAMMRAQLRMLEPLPEPDRARFMQMLKVLVGRAGNDAGGPQGEANDAST
jgi:MarR family transcriptional regulator, lower aerobic nicotinate degradation pathway regulator